MKTIHSLIIWILLLALPMQGFAAASMVACSHLNAPAVHASALDEATHCQSDVDAGDCSMHAECRMPAALAPSAAIDVPAHPARPDHSAYLDAYATAYFPDGLERPPHTA